METMETTRFTMTNNLKGFKIELAKKLLSQFKFKGEVLNDLTTISKKGYIVRDGKIITIMQLGKLKRDLSFFTI